MFISLFHGIHLEKPHGTHVHPRGRLFDIPRIGWLHLVQFHPLSPLFRITLTTILMDATYSASQSRIHLYSLPAESHQNKPKKINLKTKSRPHSSSGLPINDFLYRQNCTVYRSWRRENYSALADIRGHGGHYDQLSSKKIKTSKQYPTVLTDHGGG
jgi:hypothetical protein